MASIYSLEFWKDAGERTLSSVLLTGLAVLGGDALDVFHADWGVVGVAVGNVAVLTLLKTLVAANIGSKGTAGLTTATVPATPTGAIGEFRHEAGGEFIDMVPDDGDHGRHHLK